MPLSDNKTIAQNTIYLYIRMALIMLVSLYTVRAVLKALGVVDYGIYNAIGGVVTSLSFLTSIMSNASQRFFSLEIGKENSSKLRDYFNGILTIYILLSVVIAFIIETGGIWLLENKLVIPEERVQAAYYVLHLSLVSFIITVVSNPFRALLIANEQMNAYAYISIFETFSKLAIVYFLLNSPFDKLILYAFLTLAVSLLTNALYVAFSRKKIPIALTLYYEKNVFKEVFAYSSWTLFGSLAGVANIQGCSIVLNVFCGPVANTAFAVATQVTHAVQQFSSNFYTAVRPPLTKSYGAKETTYMNKLFYFSNKTLFVLTFIVVFPLFMNTEFILRLWLGEITPFVVDFTHIMLIYALILSLNNPITTIVQAAGRVKLYHSVVDGFALLVLPLLYLGLKFQISVNLCLWVLVVIFLFAHVLRLIILKKVIRFSILNYIKSFVVPATLVTIFCTMTFRLTATFFPKGIGHSLLSLFIGLLLPIVTSFLIMFSKTERMQILKLIRRK